jgi:hypothetical protein
MNTRKNGLPDRRFATNKAEMIKRKALARRLFIQQLVASAILGFIAGSILISTLWREANRPLITPLVEPMTFEVGKVEAVEPPFCRDVISCIRDVGEELGRDNNTIKTMIRIARYESNYNPKAKNKNSSASGVFQIIAGTWYSNDCVGDKWNYEDNIRCAYKIQGKRGFQPWEVWNNGLAK